MTITRYPAASGGGDASSGAITSNPAFVSQSALAYYCDAATGSDSNDGSLASPFLTIQKARDVLPPNINHGVVIHLAAGNYAGANFVGLNFAPGGYVAIVGVMATATGLTGLASGTLTGSTPGSDTNGTWATATNTSGGYAADELRGMFIRYDAGAASGQIHPISGNTATVITLPGAQTSPGNVAYTIVRPAAIINANTSRPGDYIIAASASSGGGLFLTDSPGTASLGTYFVDSVKITTANGIRAWASNVTAIRCWFDNSSFEGARSGGRVAVTDSAFTTNSNIAGNTAPGMRFVLTRNVFVATAASGNAMSFSVGSGLSIGGGVAVQNRSNFVYQYASAFAAGAGVYADISGDKYNGNSASGASVGLGMPTSTFIAPVSADLGGMDISNHGTGMRVAGPSAVRINSAVTGTGNVTGLSVVRGGAVQAASTVTLTGTTAEISLDGTITTLASMRAQTPKVLQNADYGSKVGE